MLTFLETAYARTSIYYCLEKGGFPCVLNHADVPVHKEEIKMIRQIIDQSVIFLTYLKFMKN